MLTVLTSRLPLPSIYRYVSNNCLLLGSRYDEQNERTRRLVISGYKNANLAESATQILVVLVSVAAAAGCIINAVVTALCCLRFF